LIERARIVDLKEIKALLESSASGALPTLGLS
jgi:hypothetical protein